MVPTTSSTQSLRSLSTDDTSKLNSLPLVDITGLDNYAINDLILELDHFIDKETIEDLQQEIKVENLKLQWGIPKDFRFTERRNKEIDLVLGELEENAYRYAGKFSEQEIKGMRKMFQTNRGEGIFDKAWVIFNQSLSLIFI